MKRQIEISSEVFHLIWSNWRSGDVDENAILQRVLILPVASPPHNEFLEELQKKGQDQKEEKIYKNPRIPPLDMSTSGEVQEFKKIRWVDDVRSALISLGGEADLASIYRKVEEIRRAAGRKIVQSLEATVRQVIEAHSSDSQNFKAGNADYFRHTGRGRWELKR